MLADTTVDFPLGEDIYMPINKIHSKPFSRNFDERLDAAKELYGYYLNFNFTNQDIETVFDDVRDYYSQDIINRAKDLLYNQKHKYGYMFS